MGLRTTWIPSLVLFAFAVSATWPAQAASPAGDPSVGARLFQGTTRFQMGGTPCIACHSAGAAGGTLGPSLTTVYARYGGARNLESVLKAIVFPAMQPVFADHPLTERERADLIAYLAKVSQAAPGAGSVSQAAPRPAGARFLLLGLLDAVVLALLAGLLWRKRLTGVRRALVARSAR